MIMATNHVTLSEDEKASLYLLDQTMGFTVQAALRAAAELCVADHLIDGPKTAQELARKLEVNSRMLHRVLSILASRNIFSASEDGRFSLNPVAQYLRSDLPDSLRGGVMMLTDETMWRPLGKLAATLRGEPVFKQIFGMPFYDYWSQEDIPDAENDFISAWHRCRRWKIKF
jgi:hypothetical protein